MTDADTSDGRPHGKGAGITAMVLGITSFVPGCCFVSLYLNFVLAILAVVFGAIGRKRPGRGMATTGLVLGILNIAIPLVLMAGGVGLSEMIGKWAEDQGIKMNAGGTQIDVSGDVDSDINVGQDDGKDDGKDDGRDDGRDDGKDDDSAGGVDSGG